MLKLFITVFSILLFTASIAQETFDFNGTRVRMHSIDIDQEPAVNFVYIPAKEPSVKTLLFVQGSGAIPLFYRKDNDPQLYFALPFKIDEVLEASACNLLLVSPPGVQCIEDQKALDDNFYKVDEKNWPIMAYRLGNNMESHLRRYGAAMHYVEEKFNTSHFLVMAHSQGSRIATALASRHSNISKLMLSAVNPLSRSHETLSKIRVEYYLGKIDFRTAQAMIESEYRRVRMLRQNSQKNPEELSELSFTDPAMLQQMLSIQQPILFAYGSQDFGTALEADKIMLEFIRHNKSNLSLKVYENMDHNLFKDDIFSWKHLFDDTLNWFAE